MSRIIKYITILTILILLATYAIVRNQSSINFKAEIPKLSYSEASGALENPKHLSYETYKKDATLSSKNPHIFWIKIETNKMPENPLLIVRPFNFDKIELYDSSLGFEEPKESQTRWDIIQDPKYTNYAKIFNLKEHSSASEYYLKITHYRAFQVDIELWNSDQYKQLDNKYHSLFVAVYFGMFLMIIVNFFFYLVIKDTGYLHYIFYNTTFLIFLMHTSGYMYHFPIIAQLAQSMNSAMMLFLACCFMFNLFAQSFLNTKQTAPKINVVVNGYMLFYAFVFLLTLVIRPIPSFIVNLINLVALTGVPLYFWLMIRLIRQGNRQAIFFTLAFSALMISIVIRILYVLSFLPESFLFAHAFTITALLEAIFFTLGLADRVLQFQKQRDSAQLISKEKTFAYELEKDFASLLNKITRKLHNENPKDFEKVVISEFLNDLRLKIPFASAAAVYEMNQELHIFADSYKSNKNYNELVKQQVFTISNMCNKKQPNILKHYSEPFNHDNSLYVIPVEMRNHEWSCMLLEIDKTFEITEPMLDFLQHYSTELIRSLINAQSLKTIRDKAEIDPLTRLFNRGSIIDRLERHLFASKQTGKTLSIAFIDIDDFKDINDSYGHEGGDKCLQKLSELLRTRLPKNTRSGRYGGDEFLIVMPDCNAQQAFERISSLKSSIIPVIVDDRLCQYTLSVGIASSTTSTSDIHELIRLADSALYSSKRDGKNTINVA
ncbi:MAG: diguanylate cyclase [Kangiellaceae bacterium]|nr:diguanylate cyclase [Kangiellaceae bacterium]